MARRFNYERAAMVLCDAVMMGDRKAAEKWDITTRSIQKYRAKLETSEQLRTLTNQYRQEQTEKWLEDIPTALSGIIQFVTSATRKLNPSKAEDLMAIVTALEAISDVKMTEKILEARLNGEG